MHRILQLTSTSDIGGTERMLLHLLAHADRTRFTYEVGSLSGSGLLTERAAALGVPAWNLAMRHALDPRGILELARRLRAGHFDLVQIYGLRGDTLARPLARLLGGSVVVSSIRNTDAWRRPPAVWLDRLTSPCVRLWISNSEAGRQSRVTRERFAARRIITIPNGIPLPPREELTPPPPEARAALERELGLAPGDGPLVVYVANLRRQKGHADMLRALGPLLADFPRLRVLCAGRDDSRGDIPALAAELGVAHAVKFLGHHPEPRRLLRHADLFILPSHFEGLPVAVMEAMAYGRAIVASSVGGVPELIQHEREGLLIKPGDINAMTDAMRRALGDHELTARMGSAARGRMEAEFSVERMSERIQEVYAWLLRTAPRPAWLP